MIIIPVLFTAVQCTNFQENRKAAGSVRTMLTNAQSPEQEEGSFETDYNPRWQNIEVPPGEDLVHLLYRNPLYHQEVRDFFTKKTNSYAITDIILEASLSHRIPAFLAFSLAWAESRYRSDAVNRNSSSIDRGLFQLNNRSFPELTEEDFYDPAVNAEKGMRYLRYCLDAGENRVVALAMYNAGRSRVNGSGAPRMTLDYISKILDYHDSLEEEFEELYLLVRGDIGSDGRVSYLLDRAGRRQ